MSEYFKKEDIFELLQKERKYLISRDMLGAEHILVHHAINLIDDELIPFSLIHCAECLFWKREWDEKNFPGNHYCPVRDKIKPPTGYCDEGVLYEAE